MSVIRKILSLLKSAYVAVRPYAKPVFIFLFYWVCIVPGGFILKLGKRDLMQRSFDADAKTYWQKRIASGLQSPLKHPF